MSYLSLTNGPRSSRNNFVEPPGLGARLLNTLPPALKTAIAKLRMRASSIVNLYTETGRRNGGAGVVLRLLRPAFSIQTMLILMWALTLWWGERMVFWDGLKACEWRKWERWPQDTLPHHVVFIADPQLVDAHTYPGRPWPLSSLTMFYADLYLFRAYSLLQQRLRPDTAFFLGDLFDGGREWGTANSSSPEPMYKGYGNKVWMNEYYRFGKLFFEPWKLGGVDSASSQRGRKIIASLPGNHDMGFGNGIQKPVHERFQVYFGEGNRVDVIGNHSFVSVDSVSLSAKDQPNPVTGGFSSGVRESHSADIWGPTEEFLNGVQALKARAITEELLALRGESENYLGLHAVEDIDRPTSLEVSVADSKADLPTILLTHVPLYRPPETPCGPLREKFPPSSTDPLPEKDERNAIKIVAGHQYQNVLTDNVSKDLVNKAGPITQVYSGDDHDYCEIIHREFSGSPKEITVKSISFAMGVRRPGFLMTSLWNPIDLDTGKPTAATSSPTLQNHLCLLPDQLSVFVQYAYVLTFTVLVLSIRAVARVFHSPKTTLTSEEPLLPISQDFSGDIGSSTTSSTSTSTPASHSENRLASRGLANFSGRSTPNSPPFNNRRPMSHVQIMGSSVNNGISDTSQQPREWIAFQKPRGQLWRSRNRGYSGFARGRSRRAIDAFRTEFLSSVKWVGGVALVWYLWLIWTW